MKSLLLLAALCSAHGQSARFEVVAIKPAAPDAGGATSRGGPGTRTPNTWMCRNLTLKNLIRIAYDTGFDGQLVVPGWTDEFGFDIDAIVPAAAAKDSLRPMLRQMLADRFALKVHIQPKEVRGYALVVAKGGPKLPAAAREELVERSQPGGGASRGPALDANGFLVPAPGVTGEWIMENRVRVQWYRITSAQLAAKLAAQAGFAIEDATGLTGLYDVSAYWLKDTHVGTEAGGPSLSEALQQQLGLRLQPKKVTIQSVVVDHVERVPTAN